MANTPQYRTILQCTPELISAVQNDLSALVGELLAAGLISENNSSTLKNNHVAEPERAADLVEFVRNKVLLDPGNYDKFIEVLKEREAEHESILKILDEKYKELLNSHPALLTAKSVPANMDDDVTDHVDRPRSMSTPGGDNDACIQWFKEKGMTLQSDLVILKGHGVSPLCLSVLREEKIAIVCHGMSIGGEATFRKLCTEACHQLPRIKETPHNEARVSSSSGVTQSGCLPIAGRAACVGNGRGRRIELDQRLEMPQHYMVCEYLRELPDKAIIMLGGALGLNHTKLEKMKNLPEDMVAAWIRREDHVIDNGEPTLRNLAEALKQPGITQTGLVAQILGSKTGVK